MAVSDLKNKKEMSTRNRWKQDPIGVRADILEVATAEFAKNGLSGARINEIAIKTKSSKRMIYYYFGDKEGLYREVLENAYKEMRTEEDQLQLQDFRPDLALRKLVEFTFDHHAQNPDFIRLVMIENIHHGQYLKLSREIKNLNVSAISKLRSIYDEGCSQGIFRNGISALQLHWQISALCFFNVSNASTFSLAFGNSLQSQSGQKKIREQIVRSVLAFVLQSDSRK